LVLDRNRGACDLRGKVMMYETENTGLGFLPSDGGGDSGGGGDIIGGVIGGIVDAIGSIIGSIGPPSDQTSYRPPADSASRCVCFADKIGTYCVAYDVTSQDSLAKAQANGNYLVDIYSYYSVFISGSLNNGASPAAQRVITDYAKNQGVSIQRAAESLLYLCGLRQIICQPGGGAPPPTVRPPTVAPPTIPQLPQVQPPVIAPPTIQAPAPAATGDNSLMWILLIVGGVVLIKKARG
jgi:hypothetical protein